jgi:hypothetical protein
VRGCEYEFYAVGFPEDGRAQAETCRELNCKQTEESLIGSYRVERRCVVNCCTRVHGKCEVLIYVRTVLCVCMGDAMLCCKVGNTLAQTC